MTKASFSPEKTRSPQPQHPPRTPARINHRLVLFIISLTAEVPRPAGRRYDPTRTPSYRHRSGPAIRRARRRPHTSGSGDGDAAGVKRPPAGCGRTACPAPRPGSGRAVPFASSHARRLPVASRSPSCPRRYAPAAGAAARVAVQACDRRGRDYWGVTSAKGWLSL